MDKTTACVLICLLSPQLFRADLYDDDEILSVISYNPWWCKDGYHKVIFTQQENEILQALPQKEYLVSDKEKHIILLGKFDKCDWP